MEKRLTNALSLDENKILRLITDRSSTGISVRDRNGNLLFCNPKWAEIWQKTDESVKEAQARKRKFLQLDQSDRYLGSRSKFILNLYSFGGDFTLNDIYVRKSKKWVNQNFYGLLNEVGEVDSVVIFTEDVTERKNAKATAIELLESTQRFHTLVENLPVAAYSTDSTGHLVSANPAMVKMFLADSKDDIYTTPVKRLYKNSGDRALFLSSLKSQGKLSNYEIELLRSDNSSFWASISANATLNAHGEIQSIDGIIRDISSEKALEKEILKAQKLESIGLLAGGIAHDFNNIMAAVLGNISLAKLYTQNNKRVTEKLEKAEKASLRASDLTRQLLTFSKGGQPVRKKKNIQKIIRESASFAATGSTVKVIYNLLENLHPVEIDESQIGQALNNIVINAIHSMARNGRIDISAINVLLEQGNTLDLPGGQYVKISIKDYGVGISAEVADRIFDPYFTTKPKGSGLGLATVYSILRNHDGKVTVDSIVGSGTIFSLYLPAIHSSVAYEKSNSVNSTLPIGQGRILIMDDDEAVLEVVKEILEQKGYSTFTAIDGKQAISMYEEAFVSGEKYDLLILDITVPGGMGGADALRKIHEVDPHAIAVVASGYANNTVMANFLDFGFVDSIAKPFTADALVNTARKALSHLINS